MKPEDVTLEQAVELLAERESRGPGGKPAKARKPTAKPRSPAQAKAAKPKSRAKAKVAAE